MICRNGVVETNEDAEDSCEIVCPFSFEKFDAAVLYTIVKREGRLLSYLHLCIIGFVREQKIFGFLRTSCVGEDRRNEVIALVSF